MLDSLTNSLEFIIHQTWYNGYYLELMTFVLCGVYLLNILTGGRLLYLGILPRHPLSLPGIFFAPLLHANFNHLFFNLIPLLVLSDFVLMNGVHYYLITTFLITLFSGLLTWFLGRSALHVGASGLITGYWGLLLCNVYQQGTMIAVILGIISGYYFIGILYGLFPSQKGVSWEGHVFGLIAGIFTAMVLH